ncbi:hypothetical protein BC833DRAFT_568674 [Globomyces pollinis-pini]|nr:hypothetical protein BC833DRAFT_568674 [Globomyces pollinis-pini]
MDLNGTDIDILLVVGTAVSANERGARNLLKDFKKNHPKMKIISINTNIYSETSLLELPTSSAPGILKGLESVPVCLRTVGSFQEIDQYKCQNCGVKLLLKSKTTPPISNIKFMVRVVNGYYCLLSRASQNKWRLGLYKLTYYLVQMSKENILRKYRVLAQKLNQRVLVNYFKHDWNIRSCSFLISLAILLARLRSDWEISTFQVLFGNDDETQKAIRCQHCFHFKSSTRRTFQILIAQSIVISPTLCLISSGVPLIRTVALTFARILQRISRWCFGCLKALLKFDMAMVPILVILVGSSGEQRLDSYYGYRKRHC